jgi:glutamine phosphoribosylpyrophosphate amidotransferase
VRAEHLAVEDRGASHRHQRSRSRAVAQPRSERNELAVGLNIRRVLVVDDLEAALAGSISEISGVPVLHGVVKRVRATPQQVGLSKSERAENVQGAFRVPPEQRAEIAGKRLVLIDDVLTSGATADTCTRALLRAGAAHVDVLVFARVVAPLRTTI